VVAVFFYCAFFYSAFGAGASTYKVKITINYT
jgi:hypothetical protein